MNIRFCCDCDHAFDVDDLKPTDERRYCRDCNDAWEAIYNPNTQPEGEST